ncbi:MAG: mandelate racemase/muconate lactonizing enzyme family protein [Microthrixaceae bacterium]|nr:mandelate racemase/muconate lactonizing enzyme family protein [Microthrixaceae bacterium]
MVEPSSACRAAPITRIELFELRVPLSALARGAMAKSDNGLGMAIPTEESWDVADFLYCRLVDEDGCEGWGEAYVWLPETGVSQTEMAMAIRDHLGKYVLGARPTDVQAMAARFDRNVARNEVAKGLVDIACHELAARQIGRPVHDLLGGAVVDRIPLCGLLPLLDPETTAEYARGYQGGGYRSLRIKLGTSPHRDRDVIAAVRDACGPDLRIRVDYNQAYDVPTAVRALSLIEPFDIDAAEQPLAVSDLLGMVELQRRTPIPVFLHEGFFSLADAVALIDAGGMGVIGVNAERPGGVTGALRAIDYAAARGLGTILHNQPLGIGTAVQAHIAAARFDRLGHDPEIAGDVMFDHHLTTTRYEVRDGEMLLPGGPGWGVTVDRDELDRHLIADPTVCTP